ncbi:DNA replication/repair protein RecF [Microbulbifer thermotolerans]|uniref:DNA replication/repair protein RecF n=1 Tax=Microbulbifer thermotolerans TaxID=252514 RepID=UPI00094334DB|nr:DNA replication/repair protein RecF [Microbulbifer thermotolerans]MCX2778510.1 DNA replication/repair protein RecF [Microbulbifer thermotolerans]MCX2782936.1 DNA replication/repair protein RecF [Microbulbifer thermotolerans]MCX2793993.1 DNA replication/repair protein RecF [Microbulbifer thermotolerans]MCX2803981.1 DNA replication/repair protein RecF [Microbulbifer thermotolerans]MCX2830809.1 DNA replication/repair protein RecF [Microbulbifer thermotolerans]
MALNRLELSNFRNITFAELSLVQGVNLFCGPNGSGKTSLLEAVHMLSTGRSFRSRKHKAVIQEGALGLTVFGRLSGGDSLGVERLADGGGRIRINRAPASSSSQLASCLPLQVINSDSFSALDGGPGVRRRLLDWAVFHVEHSFAEAWKNYQIALSQRNALLRRGKIVPDLLSVWERRLAESGEHVDALRQRLFAGLNAALTALLKSLPDSPLSRIEMSYRRGWRKEVSLIQALEESRQGDLAQGNTRVGPHRADLRFSASGEAAHQILSRGQQKMLVCALRTAMAELVCRHREKPVFLVDDLPSELDELNQLQFARWVSRCASQVLVTGIEVEATSRPWLALSPPWNSPKVFHVEHGHISAESSAAT